MEVQSTGTLQSPSTYSGSSKTGSSKSVGGSEKEKEIDLTKDTASSPIDLECHIQAERITKILDEIVYKTKLAVCLPELVNDYTTLAEILSSQDMDDLIFIFEQYDNPLFSQSLLNMAAMDDLKAGDVSLKNRLNPELGHLIYILNSYPALKPKVEEFAYHMKKDYLDKLPEDRSPKPALDYLLTLEHFREMMMVQMDTTAAEELAGKLQIRKLENSNDALISKIDENTKTLREESQNFERTMASKSETIAKLEQDLVFLHHAGTMRLKKQILDSDRQMVLASRAHGVKSEMLKEEEVETREGYQTLLRQHLGDEKNQRARRFKVETQLLSWLQKYDTEMSDKQEDFDDYEKRFGEETKKVEGLEIKLQEQDKEYIPLMEERDKEYHEELTQKMNAFLVEHAARVIQNAWREVLINRADKKKLKKLVAKMKAEQEKLQKKAEAEARAAAAAAKRAEKAAKKKK